MEPSINSSESPSNDSEEVKGQVVKIIKDPEADIEDAISLLQEHDIEDRIKRSNEVQRAVVERTKSILREGDIHALDTYEIDLLTVPEVFEIDGEFQELARQAFRDHFDDYGDEKWQVFLNSFGLYKDKEIQEEVARRVENSIFDHNGSNEEICNYLSSIWDNFVHSTIIKEAIEKVIEKFEDDGMSDTAELLRKEIDLDE